MRLSIKSLRCLAAATLSLSVLSGCTFISDPVSKMKAPQLSADKATLMAAINSHIPAGTELIRPVNDESSIFTEDLNNDGIMESLVFYRTPSEAVEIHGMILEKQGDAWVKKLVFDGDGTMLESVDLKDMTGDGKLNIITGYSRGEEKGLVVYSYSSGSLEEVLSLPYTKYMIDDLNKDGIEDITVVYFKRNEFATISIYQYNDGFKVLDKIEDIDPYFFNYYNIVAGKIAKDKEGIVLDASVDFQSAYSLIVLMEHNKLRVVLPGDTRTYKDRLIASEDIDHDGIIEVGLLEAPKGWEYFDPADIPYFTSYYKWDGKDGLTFAVQLYRDPSDRFTINFDPELHGKVSIDTKSVLDKNLKFIMTDTGETFAEVSFFSPSEWDKAKNEGWELLGRDLDKVIGYRGELEQSTTKEGSNKIASPIERKGIDE
ncbi:hypothetical protein CD191_16450 [Paenibacillus odorifer]|uniref:VCBS repeat-containing protein n=1 Tax=Paenibacillus odorifer TaxID=189426 RepID=A0A1R0Z6Z9_9BACL|nr:hypothetical protein CD191_16450 [Paenibacillus odorifer]OMD02940.1 hypothetical protein BJP46_14290 [Paenibacillus odorifer]OME18656.1 hypothetical protein BSK60_01020 [Paenibacillus odorifer]OME23049.1 hypothetical protein BSK47_04940 [Paenibacillus odorifer]